MKKIVRALGAVTTVIGTTGLVVSGYHAARTPFDNWPAFDTPLKKLFNHYSYFTQWSNILGTAIAAQYALGKRPASMSIARVDAVAMLATTGIVFNTILAKDSVIEGLLKFTNPIVHTIMPIAVPALWLLDDHPSPDLTTKNIAWSFAFPLAWAGYAFARGVQTNGYYPYDFINPKLLGYPTAVRNIMAVSAGHGALVAAMTAWERARLG